MSSITTYFRNLLYNLKLISFFHRLSLSSEYDKSVVKQLSSCSAWSSLSNLTIHTTHTHTGCEVYYRRVVEQNLPGLFKRLVQGPVQEVTDKITCGGESPWVPYTSTHTDINLTERTSALFCVSPPCVNAVQPLLCVWPSRSLWRSDSSGSTDLATPKLLSVLLDPHEGWAMCI